MKSIIHILLLAGILASTSVSAKSPPRHGVVKESKMKECPYISVLTTGSETSVFALACIDEMPLISYTTPERNWMYVDVVDVIYTVPYVARIDAFFARSTC